MPSQRRQSAADVSSAKSGDAVSSSERPSARLAAATAVSLSGTFVSGVSVPGAVVYGVFGCGCRPGALIFHLLLPRLCESVASRGPLSESPADPRTARDSARAPAGDL